MTPVLAQWPDIRRPAPFVRRIGHPDGSVTRAIVGIAILTLCLVRPVTAQEPTVWDRVLRALARGMRPDAVLTVIRQSAVPCSPSEPTIRQYGQLNESLAGAGMSDLAAQRRWIGQFICSPAAEPARPAASGGVQQLPPTVVATAASQLLTTARLAEILSRTEVPIEKDELQSIVEHWIIYQLAGAAASKGDSLADVATMRDALWSRMNNIRVQKFYEVVSRGWDALAPDTDERRYLKGEALAARHILVKADSEATATQIEAARVRATRILSLATPENFVSLTALSEEQQTKERKGDLGAFLVGAMVPEFEQCLLELKIGEISKEPCRTDWGWHVIYRPPYADVKDSVAVVMKQRNVAIAESLYLADLEAAKRVVIASNAAVIAKAVASNPLAYARNTDVVATYTGGELTLTRLADWIAAYPTDSEIRSQLVQAPDTLAEKFVRQIVRNELVLRQTDSAKVQLTTAEVSELYGAFQAELLQVWRDLGIEPDKLVSGNKAVSARARIDAFVDTLILDLDVAFVDVPSPVSRALHRRYPFAINEAGIDEAIAQAQRLRDGKTPGTTRK